MLHISDVDITINIDTQATAERLVTVALDTVCELARWQFCIAKIGQLDAKQAGSAERSVVKPFGPNTFVICCVRIVTGSILGLVISFYLQDILQTQRGTLPSIAFFIGFFPSRGLLFIEKVSMSILKFASQEYASTPLSQLPGMSYAHEVRLNREGFDNIENLTEADPLELTLRTGFIYGQLETWISQAKLVIRLGSDYHSFYKATGIESITSLNDFLKNWQQTGKSGDPSADLNEATGNNIKGKIKTLCTLECKDIWQQAERQGKTS